MFAKPIGFAWKMLPSWMRLKIIRATQQKFTVSAAAVVTNREGKVLLLNHLLRPYSGWGLPGGFLTAFEQPHDAIKRELLEETGIQLARLEMIRVRTIKRHVEILFRAESDGEPSVQSREIIELGWFSMDDLPAGLPLSQRFVIQQVLDRWSKE